MAQGYLVNVNWLNNKKYKDEFDKWRKTLQYSTTARNRLLNLYKFVSPSVHSTIVIY